MGRKTVRDGGATARAIIAQVRATEAQLTVLGAGGAHGADFKAILHQLSEGSVALEAVVDYVVGNTKTDIKAVFAGSVPYLRLAGIVLGGWQMARAALIAQQKLEAGADDAPFYQAKIGDCALLCRSHPVAGIGTSQRDRRRQRRRAGYAHRPVLERKFRKNGTNFN